jgi:DNA-binding CsgD family transcriptional regulator/PAS domain-containing protein
VAEPSLSERAATLLECLFETPTEPTTWRRFLGALGAQMGDGLAVVLLGEVAPGGPRMILADGVDVSSVRKEDLTPAATDLSPESMPVGKAVAVQDGDLGFARTQLFRNLLSSLGLPPGPGVYVVLSRNARELTSALIVLSRDPTWKPTQHVIDLLELLASYITLAAGTGLRLHEERSKASALLRSLARLQMGVLLLDVGNRVSFANDSALEMLGLGGATANDEGVRDRATRALGSLVKRETGDSTRTLTYTHPEDGRPLSVLCAPLRWGEARDAERRRFSTALFVSDPHGTIPDPGLALRELYGLSPSEARLAEQLTAGHKLAEAAKNLGIKLRTARGVLRSIFEKTGTHRQSSLVRLILSGPGQVRSTPRGDEIPPSESR